MAKAAVSEDALTKAQRLLAAGRHRRASVAAGDWVRDHPNDSMGYHILGACFAALGNAAAASTALGRAVQLSPERSDHRVAFATALGIFGDIDRARREFAIARALEPSSLFGTAEFALVCLCRGAPAEAEELFLRVLKDDPHDRQARLGVVMAKAAAGALDVARAEFAVAAADDPELHRLPGGIAAGLEGQGRHADAETILSLAAAVAADDPELAFRLAAAKGDHVARAPDSYVRSHFDRFADTFDHFLVDELQYRVPELIAEAGLRHVTDSVAPSILDAGCGTGLCGPLLRPAAGHLVGVDISGAMLEKAAARGIYDELERAELTQALRGRAGRHDLIVAADVLVYFGDLGAVMRAASDALKPRGVLAISTELAETGEWTLQDTGRYAHASGYVEGAASDAALALAEASERNLRRERGEWLRGQIWVFVKR